MIFKKKQERQAYDKNIQKPMIRSSICTGEKVAGFQDMRTGKFTEIMLIRTPADLDEFRRLYGIGEREISTQY
ncbi:aspartate dehydrogenase [Pseudoflavonifractor phocaeensis]|uniref:aspartate dehydrogenase n=1 Tax=Pseudoflavonifractor phocaeensis TaxID=1870988 RepID=UPI001957FA04|nr:aspartate dehydrogenase [Pseudoflavonifractor phocaeensis]MBM6926113.1 aspartate dehydrogenase [Pseudoflavonifractor phocaeensis]